MFISLLYVPIKFVISCLSQLSSYPFTIVIMTYGNRRQPLKRANPLLAFKIGVKLVSVEDDSIPAKNCPSRILKMLFVLMVGHHLQRAYS
jgi:hypothetical protein